MWFKTLRLIAVLAFGLMIWILSIYLGLHLFNINEELANNLIVPIIIMGLIVSLYVLAELRIIKRIKNYKESLKKWLTKK